MLVGSVVDDVALIDAAGAGKLCTARTNIDVTFLVEDEVGPAEGAIVARRLVPHRHMGRDLAVNQPLEQPCHAINGVAYEPLRPKIEARSTMVWVIAISSLRLARVPSASRMIPTLLWMR